MNAQQRHNSAHRAGEWLARACKRIVRWERRFAAWLGANGLPKAFVVALIWILRLSAVVLAVYATTLLVFLAAGLLLLAFIGTASSSTEDAEEEPFEYAEDEPIWRKGSEGYGLC